MTRISETVTAWAGPYFKVMQVIFPIEGNARVGVARGRELPLARRTGREQVVGMSLWAPVAIDLALLVSADDDYVFLDVGSKSMREHLVADVVKSQRDR